MVSPPEYQILNELAYSETSISYYFDVILDNDSSIKCYVFSKSFEFDDEYCHLNYLGFSVLHCRKSDYFNCELYKIKKFNSNKESSIPFINAWKKRPAYIQSQGKTFKPAVSDKVEIFNNQDLPAVFVAKTIQGTEKFLSSLYPENYSTETFLQKRIHILILGDSTIRQWYEHFESRLGNATYKIDPEKPTYFAPRTLTTKTLKMTYASHAMPLHNNAVQPSQLINMCERIRKTNWSEYPENFIIIGFGPHFYAFPFDIFEERINELNECLVMVPPYVKVFIKLPNYFENDARWSPCCFSQYFSFTGRELMKSYFTDKRFKFIDTWPQTILAEKINPFDLHPSENQVKSAIENQFLPLACGDACKVHQKSYFLPDFQENETDLPPCQSCSEGDWSCKENSDVDKTWDFILPQLNIPSVSKMLIKSNDIDTECGLSNVVSNGFLGYRFSKFCDPSSEKSCCKRAFTHASNCVEKKHCSKNSYSDIDVSQYRDPEKCFWKPKTGKLELITKAEIVEKFSGKNLVFIGDSHARHMFVTFLGVMKEDFSFPGFNFEGSIINCEPGQPSAFLHRCRDFARNYYSENVNVSHVTFYNEASFNEQNFQDYREIFKVFRPTIFSNGQNFDESRGSTRDPELTN